jgi:hypothetical protein
MRRLVASLPLALLLAACSPSSPNSPQQQPPKPEAGQSAPANAALGSAGWYAWVDQTLGIDDGNGHGPDPGSAEWNQTVQRKLGQEAPQSQPGSPEWQQSVDALLRTRVLPPH